MLLIIVLGLMFFPFNGLCDTDKTDQDWPVLKKYDSPDYGRIALPVGGIGSGTISLGGRGDIRDWEIMNRAAKGYTSSGYFKPFFAISAKIENQRFAKVLEGPIDLNKFHGYFGSQEPNHGMPRFPQATFLTTYPFGKVILKDPDIPLDISVEAYNPFIPGDADASSLPVMILTYRVKNNTENSIEVSICGNIPNIIGNDGWENEIRRGNGTYVTSGEKDNKNEYRETKELKGIYMSSEGVDSLSSAWGTMALVTHANEFGSYRTGWQVGVPFESLAEYWEDFLNDGILKNYKNSEYPSPMASLAISKKIPAGESVNFPFFIFWQFPNRKTWTPVEGENNIIGNYYSTQYEDAWDAAGKITPRIPDLRNRTLSFLNAFMSSSIPSVVKEAALFNISTLRSPTTFRTPNGFLHGWEGSFERGGCCWGNCTHVWNYEQVTPFLFGNLAKTMRIAEFKYATGEDGLMSFRIGLPLETRAKQVKKAAADGQMGSVMQLYREWQLSGDDEFLKDLWPQAKKALSFAWIHGGWDADMDGVMEGSQHNTMDVEYFGPNPLMGFWYLGALKAAHVMADYLGDEKFADTCLILFESGSAYLDENLFNGEYYIQKIMPSPKKEDVYPGLFYQNLLGRDHPHWQVGEGCLIDQLAGQYMAHICDLGYLANPKNIKTTLKSIMKYNYRDNMFDHFNNRRSYVLGNESALLMVHYPDHVKKEKRPFIYATESMTGFEYTAASGMIYEGLNQEGITVIDNIRKRFDGIKRNPFSETEAGFHYARAMASWSAIIALSGFNYSAVNKSISFTSNPGKYFWSNGYSWGTCLIEENRAELEIISGSLQINKFNIKGVGTIDISGSPINNEEKIEIEF
jgi:uncharacterized protein (DUF608 family)